jgi:hypothetical protein
VRSSDYNSSRPPMINEPDQMEEEEKELETEELEEKNHIQIRQIEEIE